MIQQLLVKLPEDVVIRITEFLGIQILRNGIYMCQIPRTDPRYKLLLKIPTKTIHQNCGFTREDGTTNRSINFFIATVKFASTGYSIMEINTSTKQIDHTIEIVHSIYKYNNVRSTDMLQWRYITSQHPSDTMEFIVTPEIYNHI